MKDGAERPVRPSAPSNTFHARNKYREPNRRDRRQRFLSIHDQQLDPVQPASLQTISRLSHRRARLRVAAGL
jgi:hypothetical protein